MHLPHLRQQSTCPAYTMVPCNAHMHTHFKKLAVHCMAATLLVPSSLSGTGISTTLANTESGHLPAYVPLRNADRAWQVAELEAALATIFTCRTDDPGIVAGCWVSQGWHAGFIPHLMTCCLCRKGEEPVSLRCLAICLPVPAVPLQYYRCQDGQDHHFTPSGQQ